MFILVGCVSVGALAGVVTVAAVMALAALIGAAL